MEDRDARPGAAQRLVESCPDGPRDFERLLCVALGAKGRNETIKNAAIQAAPRVARKGRARGAASAHAVRRRAMTSVNPNENRLWIYVIEKLALDHDERWKKSFIPLVPIFDKANRDFMVDRF